MRKIFLLLIFVNISCYNLAQTVISGGVVNGTWAKANSPYIIQGAIMIANTNTLTIEPGVVVNFQGSYKFLVLGQLIAVGTAADSITFTASDTSVGWLGIRFDNTSSTNDSSRFYYCKFEYGKTIASPYDCGGSFYFKDFSKAIISNSRISNCSTKYYGGGIYCNNSSPIIIHNIISNNTAGTILNYNYNGGGIYCDGGNAIISYNVISHNIANGGGGIFCNGNQTISYNIISNNSTISLDGQGGGICCEGSCKIISNNVILNNTARKGGGIYFSNASSVRSITKNIISYNNSLYGGGIFCTQNPINISSNTISYNNCSYNGGGICVSYCSPKISCNNISNNIATNDGGGISCATSNPTLSNNVVSNNTSSNGGGISFSASSPMLINNTISNNLAQKGGALFCTISSNPNAYNTILWNNDASSSGSQVYLDDEPSDPYFYFCNIKNNMSGFGLNANVFYLGTYQNNIDIEPLFVSPSTNSGTGFNGTNADWSLQYGSLSIDSGDTTRTYDSLDLAGNPRVTNNRIDIGAYEYITVTNLIENYQQLSFQIYPNPNNGQFFFSSSELEGKNSELLIVNVLGETVYKTKVTGKQMQLDLSQQAKGIYYLKLQSDNFTEVRKIILQ